ncbi:MAG TPA: TonB family protein [Blastocatellia bacterium]|jgi:TonB family protein
MRHTIRALFLFTIAGALLSPITTSAQQNPDRYIERARQWIAEGSYDDAARQLKRALEINPDSAEANLLLAKVFQHKGQTDVAIKYAEEALKHKPDYAEAHNLLARLFLDKGDSEAALREVDAAIALGISSADIHTLKARIYTLKATLLVKKKLYADAIESLEQALNLAESEETTHIRRYIEDLKTYSESVEKSLEASSADPTVQRPLPLNRPRPAYTEEARGNKIQGSIHLVARIDEQGEVTNVLLLWGLGYGLDEEAERAVRQMKFSPAVRDGKPIPFWVSIEMEFNLR